ncbi:amidase [Phyllobacterium zundukense]|uniref:Amidase domain-containing protein n=1 Tax=Phyllobacterium zundukense TaxID=1867719 RepID=A0A2N9VYQ4_9HYPH|nr:amidase [Phyllobacterium zundukense]ATU95207.1 hypothetical protein BLM14_26075 [Phyllobacterium zundukense]PIO44622.1 hypothetical protein B5P45_12235 [Phyllobacterium zundukense]
MLSAVQIAADIAAGRIAPEHFIKEAYKAYAELEPQVQAFVEADFETARIASLTASGPLRGLPFAAKDNFDTTDFSTACGSSIYQGHRPTQDAASVTLARNAGANLVGKTTLAEFALFKASATRNPHDLTRTPGGSSSGSAAAVAAGMAAFALGTQTAGSVIRPAAFCGVAAYKPSYDLLPMSGVKLLAPSLDTVGLFAATVSDLTFVASTILGRSPIGEVDPRALRLGICSGWQGAVASSGCIEALGSVTTSMKLAGAHVARLELPDILQQAHQLHEAIMGYEAVRALAEEREFHGSKLSDRLAAFLDENAAQSDENYGASLAVAVAAREAVAELFSAFDAIITPSAPGEAPIGLESTGSSEFNRLWTLLHLPVVNVSGMKGAEGLPLGIQVVGAHGDDDRILPIAASVERVILNSY